MVPQSSKEISSYYLIPPDSQLVHNSSFISLLFICLCVAMFTPKLVIWPPCLHWQRPSRVPVSEELSPTFSNTSFFGLPASSTSTSRFVKICCSLLLLFTSYPLLNVVILSLTNIFLIRWLFFVILNFH